MEINIFEHEPHKDEYYFDSEGKRITLEKLVRLEPDWAANVIRSLKIKVKANNVFAGTHNALRIRNGHDPLPDWEDDH